MKFYHIKHENPRIKTQTQKEEYKQKGEEIMSQSMSMNNDKSFNGYVQLNGGYIKTNTYAPKVGIGAGVEYEKNNFHAKGGVEIGTHLQGKAEVGYELPLDSKGIWGLDLSAKAQHTVGSSVKNESNVNITTSADINFDDLVSKIEQEQPDVHEMDMARWPNPEQALKEFLKRLPEDKLKTLAEHPGFIEKVNEILGHEVKEVLIPKTDPNETPQAETSTIKKLEERNPYETRAGLEAALTYNPSFGKFKIGVEGGYRKYDSGKNIINRSTTTITEIYDNKINVEQYRTTSITPDKKKEMYITPTFSGEVKVAKNLSLTGDANLYEGQVGIKYTF